jgi:cell division protein DivIC
MFSKLTISSKISIAALLILLIFLGELKYRQFSSQRQIAGQEQSLQQQTDQLQKQNEQLSESLQYINSADFKESIAREQLGLKKQGELVYGFTNSNATSSQIPAAATGSNDFQKWWNYFFNSQSGI